MEKTGMETKIYRITDVEKDRDKIKEAADVLMNGGLVAFPTDTVYAVGACISRKEAVERIFEVKNRPKDNPLGVLVARDLDMHLVADVTAPSTTWASEFIEAFWPGPLTLVMPSVGFRVISEITAGRDTIAVRQPDNEIARALIGECDEPVAAPSANVSGHPSPTTGQDVIEEMNGKVDIILVGEDCPVGIESTILLIKEDHPILLRKGAITKEQLQEVVPKKILELEVPPQDSL